MTVSPGRLCPRENFEACVPPSAYPGTVPVVDTEWVLAKIDEFVGLIEATGRNTSGPENIKFDDQIKALLPVMERIAAVVEPDRPHQWRANVEYSVRWLVARDTALRLRAIVVSQAEVDAALGPSGPTLAASGLHRGVWQAAAELWDDGHLRHAVQNAATFVDLRLQAKLERQDTSGADLAMQAFRIEKLKPGDRVLRFRGLVEGGETFKSRHEGAKFFGAGVMLAIRNPATHDLTQPSPNVALEYLAALSILARWIDEADVYVVP